MLKALKPDEEFLCLLSSVVGSRWPNLAVSLLLSEVEIEWLKEMVGLSQQDLGFRMLKNWASKEAATYGQLCHGLKIIHLFQHTATGLFSIIYSTLVLSPTHTHTYTHTHIVISEFD